MKSILLVLLSGLIVVAFAAQSKAASKLQPLYFQANKNNVQVLPQRFEYTLIDDDRLKIGDILIDTTKVTFSIEAVPKKKGVYQITFNWPYGLLKDGEISIKNNSGKAILNLTPLSEDIKIQQVKPDADQENLRSDIATFTTTEFEPQIIDDMKYMPFVTFCIYRATDETHTYLCSKELFVSATPQGQIDIKPRSATKKIAQIEINGKVVGNQGIISLDNNTETVSFNAQTQTGAFIEVETRKKEVDFKDVVSSDDDKRIILTGTGAEPVDESKVKKISDTEWQISLNKERPLMYLKGDGDIPLRQEFFIRGNLPKEKDRAFVSARSAHRTYSSEMTIQGVFPATEKIALDPADKDAQLEPLKQNQFFWSLKNIASGVESRRYLMVESDKDSFVAGYDLFRGTPYSLYLGAKMEMPSSIAYANLGFQMWFENFLTITAPWSRLHWGMSLDHEQHLTTKDDIVQTDRTTLTLKWRANPGFYFSDESWGLELPLHMVKGESSSAIAYGLGGFLYKKPNHFMSTFMSWSEFHFDYFLGSSGSDFKVKAAYILGVDAYWKFANQWYLRYGVGFNGYKYDPTAPKEDSQLELNAALFWRF